MDVCFQEAVSTQLSTPLEQRSKWLNLLLSWITVIAIPCQALMSNGLQINPPDPQTRLVWRPEEQLLTSQTEESPLILLRNYRLLKMYLTTTKITAPCFKNQMNSMYFLLHLWWKYVIRSSIGYIFSQHQALWHMTFKCGSKGMYRLLSIQKV